MRPVFARRPRGLFPAKFPLLPVCYSVPLTLFSFPLTLPNQSNAKVAKSFLFTANTDILTLANGYSKDWQQKFCRLLLSFLRGTGAEEELAESTITPSVQRIRVKNNMAAKRVFDVNEASVRKFSFLLLLLQIRTAFFYSKKYLLHYC